MTDINEIYSALTAPTAPPTSNISAAEANGVPSPVDNGKPASETPAAPSEPVAESTKEGETAADVAPAADAPAEEPAKPADKPAEKQDSFAKRFAMATQKEKELRQRELEIQKREADLKKAGESKVPPKEDILAGLDAKRQPLTALNRLGISIQDVQEAILRGEKAPEVDPLDEKLKPFRDAVEEVKSLKQQLAERDAAAAQKSYENQVAGVKAEIAREADKGEHDLVKNFGQFGVDTVFETMQLYYNQYEKVLTYQEACAIVEADFEERFMPGLVASNKLKAKLQPQVSAKAASEQPDKGKQKSDKSPSTLTNKQSSMPSASAPDTSKMSRDELIEHLAKTMVKHRD